MFCDGVTACRLNSSMGVIEANFVPDPTSCRGRKISALSKGQDHDHPGRVVGGRANPAFRLMRSCQATRVAAPVSIAGRDAPLGRESPAPRGSGGKLLRALQLLAERLAVDAEHLGCARLVAPGDGQNIADIFGLHLGEGPVKP